MTRPIMPKFYFGRLRGNSDRDWIQRRMAVIPEDKQQEVADEYERKYRNEKSFNRKKANTWLNGIAQEYRPKKAKRASP